MKTVLWLLLGFFSIGSAEEHREILEAFCFDCHGTEKQKGDLRLDTLSTDFSNAETWHDALDQLNRGEMPPPKAKQLPTRELQKLTTWLNRYLREAAAAKRFANGRVGLRRLTRYEYANTMRDLLNLDHVDFARELPPDPPSPDGFLNNGSTLEMSPPQLETYLKIAREALEIAIVDPNKEYEKIVVNQTESAKGRLPNRKDGGHQPVQPEYIIDLPKFPRRGEFEIEITARLANPGNSAFPKMVVSLGHVPGIIHVPRKVVGEAELSSTSSQTFVFRGRMEDFPQAGDIPFGNSGFKGMIGMIDFLDADGNQIRYPDRGYAQLPPKPKKGQKPKPRPPEKPFGGRLDIQIESAEFRGPIPRKCLSQSSGIKEFATRAFRRPVPEGLLLTFQELYQDLRNKSFSHEGAMRETFAAILVSPHFLYISDAEDNYGLAARLSYFLWSTMPDATLLRLAKTGTLNHPDILTTQVDRMLTDSRSYEFVRHFTDQWLDLDALDRVAVNPSHYPEFNNSLKIDFRREARSVFAEILYNDLTMLELLDSDWTMANYSLSKHYGTKTNKSSSLELIHFNPQSRRGGLLGQGAFHLIGSDGEQSHPIKRAVWILDRLLDDPPGSPPPDTPELDTENPDLAKLPLKEQLAVHRKRESCRNCHEGIDPWGLSLESFDAVGNWKTDTSSEITSLPDGTKISDITSLKAYLVNERQTWFARSLIKRLMSYALGRSLDLGDRDEIDRLTERFVFHDYRLRPLIVDLVQSEVFGGEL